jgi:Recombination endonuclease VII
VPDRECVICGTPFTPLRSTGKTCSLDCQVQYRRKLNREKARRHYKPRPIRPDTQCETCQAPIPAPKSGRMPRWCASCLVSRQVARGRERVSVRRCYKCQVPVPEAARKPGPAVCEGCRSERPRDRYAYERRRTLRKYGLTQEQYDQLLATQGGRCPGCGTGNPGAKGWCIDHCHRSGQVRALLCMRCNTMLGLADEDPAVLRSLADWLERQTTQSGVLLRPNQLGS